ncbi:hypothetical protein AB0L63_23685 [Nocardia sp. NPDC051990]|uniref:hypothetical protein n=1 Tax=Nocardia sp. NPDC051990 TaxID=3155285 RepID=UPI00342B3CD1
MSDSSCVIAELRVVAPGVQTMGMRLRDVSMPDGSAEHAVVAGERRSAGQEPRQRLPAAAQADA